MKTSIILAVIILGLISLPFACQYIEEPYRYYSKHTDDIYLGNWVPKIFPMDITNIHKQHNIDTNEVWLRFVKGSEQVITNQMAKLSMKEKENLRISKPFLALWWFGGIIEQQPSNDGALYADLYKGECGVRMTSFLALEKNGKSVYWWCQGE